MNKATPHMAQPDPTERGVIMLTERDIILIDHRVSCVGGREASKGK